MEAKAIAKTVRIAPRKVRLVVDLVRGKDVKNAQDILKFTPRGASQAVLKVLNSAKANAVNNNKMDEKKLFVKEIFVDEGPTLKRYLPRAKGSANSLLKRTSHITVVLGERE